MHLRKIAILALATGLGIASHALAEKRLVPETVKFMSADGKTMLIGYVFKPQQTPRSERFGPCFVAEIKATVS